MKITNLRELRKAYCNPYTWPGAYPNHFRTDDGSILCHMCVFTNYHHVVSSIKDNLDNGWKVIELFTNLESELYCDNCGEKLERTYGGDNE